jgi:hypothetical protein
MSSVEFRMEICKDRIRVREAEEYPLLEAVASEGLVKK